jgi:hypothetical protein
MRIVTTIVTALWATSTITGCARETRSSTPPSTVTVTQSGTATAMPTSNPATPTCIGLPSECGAPMPLWYDKFAPAWDKLAASFTAVGHAMRTEPPDFAAINERCQNMDDARQQVQAALPVPDQTMTTTIQEMLGNVTAIAKSCEDWNADTPASEVSNTMTLIEKASGQIDVLNLRLRQMTGGR